MTDTAAATSIEQWGRALKEEGQKVKKRARMEGWGGLGLADSNGTSGLGEADDRDPPQSWVLHSQLVYNKEMELP